MSRRRRFNRGERAELYLAADGCCARCGAALVRGWHADHRVPFSRGGATDVANGQAYCPECNRQKGDRVVDKFKPRKKQLDIANLAVERARERNLTPIIGLLAPGFGKELAWQYTATRLLREKLIDRSIVFTPRTNLCRQAELGWWYRDTDGDEHGTRLGFVDPVPHSFVWPNGNKPPLCEPPEFGYVTTNASLVRAKPNVHLDFAQRHSGRVLLVFDEAAGLGGVRIGGEADDDELATKLAGKARQLVPHAAAVLLLTGAPDRGDGARLVLCEDRYVKRDDGRWDLDPDVHATYREGVGLGYLLPVHVEYRDGHGRPVSVDGTEGEQRTVDEDQRLVWPLIHDPAVYQAMLNGMLDQLADLRRAHPHRFAAVACADIALAKDVAAYVKRVSGLRVAVAHSKDNAAAREALEDARRGLVDVLVFVRMAYIGYDAPAMAILCLLTNIRDESALTQTVGRPIRVDPRIPLPEQSAHIITLDDSRSRAFFERMREDSRLGLAERTTREPKSGPVPERLQWDSLGTDGSRHEDLDGAIPRGDEALVYMRGEDIPDTPAGIRSVANIIAKVRSGESATATATEVRATPAKPLTKTDRVQDLKRKTTRNLKGLARVLQACHNYGEQQAFAEAGRMLARSCRMKSVEATDEYLAGRRFRASVQLCRSWGIEPDVVD